ARPRCCGPAGGGDVVDAPLLGLDFDAAWDAAFLDAIAFYSEIDPLALEMQAGDLHALERLRPERRNAQPAVRRVCLESEQGRQQRERRRRGAVLRAAAVAIVVGELAQLPRVAAPRLGRAPVGESHPRFQDAARQQLRLAIAPGAAHTGGRERAVVRPYGAVVVAARVVVRGL